MIKKFIDTYGELLDTDQNEFFERAEYALELEDYSILVDMIKNSQIELKPEIIFDGYKEYKLIGSNTHIYSFLQDNFEKVLTDFNGLNIKRFQDNEHLFRKEDIFITQHKIGDSIIKVAYLSVNMEDSDPLKDKVNPNLQLKFENIYNTNTITLTYYLSDLEEIFKIMKFIPNYGIGWNPVELDEVINNFIKATKECLGVNN